MRPFVYQRADSADGVRGAFTDAGTAPPTAAAAQFLAGGTTILDLMKLDVMRPERLVDINPLQDGVLGQIQMAAEGLRLGALARMSEAAEHPVIRRDYPVIAQTLQLAA